MQLSHLAARHPAAILAYIHCGEMSVSVCACAATDALMSPPQQQHHYSNYSRHFSPEMKTPSAMRVEVAGVRARVHARLRKITPKASVCACVHARTHLWSGCFCPCTSRSTAQIRSLKRMLVWGESGSPGPRHAEETGSHTLTHDAHTHEGGPEPNGTVRTLSDRTDCQIVQHQ